MRKSQQKAPDRICWRWKILLEKKKKKKRKDYTESHQCFPPLVPSKTVLDTFWYKFILPTWMKIWKPRDQSWKTFCTTAIMDIAYQQQFHFNVFQKKPKIWFIQSKVLGIVHKTHYVVLSIQSNPNCVLRWQHWSISALWVTAPMIFFTFLSEPFRLSLNA